MSSDKTQNLQDVASNHVRSKNCDSFSGQRCKLQGIITWFDNFVLLRRDGHSQLVYKHAISTVMPVTPVSLYGEDDEEGVIEEAETDLTNSTG